MFTLVVVAEVVAKSGTSFVPDKKIEVTGDGLHVNWFDDRGQIGRAHV